VRLLRARDIRPSISAEGLVTCGNGPEMLGNGLVKGEWVVALRLGEMGESIMRRSAEAERTAATRGERGRGNAFE
jgi:hypothetical protein